MKIGVLTFHASINPGAFWQTYATCQLLRSMGHDVEVIDYCHAYRHRCNRDIFSSAKRLRSWRRPDLLARSCLMRYYAKRSRRELTLSRQLDQSEDISKLSYDALIVGSDVVWESPIDPPFLGAGLNAGKLIAYAASAGKSKAEDTAIPAELARPSPFSAISVRDANTEAFLRRGHPSWSKSIQLISDPTITLQIPDACKRRPRNDKYLMVYCSQRLSTTNRIAIQAYAREHNLKVISIFYRQPRMTNVFA